MALLRARKRPPASACRLATTRLWYLAQLPAMQLRTRSRIPWSPATTILASLYFPSLLADPWDLRDRKVILARKAQPGLLDHKDLRDRQDRKVRKDRQALMARLGQPG